MMSRNHLTGAYTMLKICGWACSSFAYSRVVGSEALISTLLLNQRLRMLVIVVLSRRKSEASSWQKSGLVIYFWISSLVYLKVFIFPVSLSPFCLLRYLSAADNNKNYRK